MKYCNTGIAYTENGEITINKNLMNPRWKKLREAIITHELEHAPGEYNLKDLEHDINTQYDVPQIDLWLFTLRHPLALTALFAGPRSLLWWTTATTAFIIGYWILP